MVTKEQAEKHTRFRWKGTNQWSTFEGEKVGDIREDMWGWEVTVIGKHPNHGVISQSNALLWEVVE